MLPQIEMTIQDFPLKGTKISREIEKELFAFLYSLGMIKSSR